MNKKLNTVLFMLGATALNLIIMSALALFLLMLFGLSYRNIEEVSTGLSWLAIIVILFGSIVGTFLLYSRIIRWIVKRWKLESCIEPIFRTSKRR